MQRLSIPHGLGPDHSPASFLSILSTFHPPFLTFCNNSCCIFSSYYQNKQINTSIGYNIVDLYSLAPKPNPILGCAAHGTYTSGDMTMYYHIDSWNGTHRRSTRPMLRILTCRGRRDLADKSMVIGAIEFQGVACSTNLIDSLPKSPTPLFRPSSSALSPCNTGRSHDSIFHHLTGLADHSVYTPILKTRQNARRSRSLSRSISPRTL